MMKISSLVRVEGPNIVLRLIRPDDAEYVYYLRSDARYNTHLSPVTGTFHDQRAWIEKYKIRENNLEELYYVIERKDGLRCGLVRLYDFNGANFTWGSWILDENKTQKAALESAVLVYEVAFNKMNFQNAIFFVTQGNTSALEFHYRFGALEIRRDERKVDFIYSRARFEADRPRYEALLGAELPKAPSRQG